MMRSLAPFCLPLLLLLSLLLGTPAVAEDRLVPQDVADLATAVHLSRDAFVSRLREAAPHLSVEAPRPLDLDDDPFLWTIDGAFGAPSPAVPAQAALVHCARYGLATRDLLGARAASDPMIFPIVNALRAETRDAEVWPPDAIALLRCSFTWVDAERVVPWQRQEAETLFATMFTRIDGRDDQGRVLGSSPGPAPTAPTAQQFGPGGFRLDGRDAPRGVFYWLESMTVARQVSHHRVAFRVYLLSGGV